MRSPSPGANLVNAHAMWDQTGVGFRLSVNGQYLVRTRGRHRDDADEAVTRPKERKPLAHWLAPPSPPLSIAAGSRTAQSLLDRSATSPTHSDAPVATVISDLLQRRPGGDEGVGKAAALAGAEHALREIGPRVGPEPLRCRARMS